MRQFFLVFSDDWGEHPSSCQHLFKRIAQDHQVLWVNTVGMRAPRLSLLDLKKAGLKLSKMFFKSNKKPTADSSHLQLTVIQPFMLPFPNLWGAAWFNRYSVIKAVKKSSTLLGLASPIMVITAPNAHDYIGQCNESKVIYYCVDDFSEWPGLEKIRLQAMEHALTDKADVFLATSEKLYNTLNQHNKKTTLLTHGVDINFFSHLPAQEHDLLANIPLPRVGYYGLFDDRSDLSLLHDIATKMPTVSFVMTGDIETDISCLQSLNNVYFTGSIPYTELPAMAKGYTLCMLPYKINTLTDAIQPLKIKEYIATKKPVISTPLKEALKLTDYITIAATANEWVTVIQSELNTPTPVNQTKITLFLKDESWESKAQLFLEASLSL